MGLSRARAEDLISGEYVATVADLYTLSERVNGTADAVLPPLKERAGWGNKSVANLMASIDARRTVPFPK